MADDAMPRARKRTRLSARPRSDTPPDGSAKVDYEVGYGKPPQHSRFKPGRSGNPKGRPKRSKNVKTVMTEELDRQVTVKVGHRHKKLTKREAIVVRLLNDAMQGKPAAVRVVMSQLPAIDSDTGQEPETLSEGVDWTIIKSFLKTKPTDV